MALFKFANAILLDRPIEVYNRGQMRSDFTFVDDIVEGMMRVMDTIALPIPRGMLTIPILQPQCPLSHLQHWQSPTRGVDAIHPCPGRDARKKSDHESASHAAGRCAGNLCRCQRSRSSTGFAPSTTIEDGIKRFVDWFLPYRQSNPDLLR